jgi:hypothetical protein
LRREAPQSEFVFVSERGAPFSTAGFVDWLWASAEKAELPIMCFAPGRTAAFGGHYGQRS